MTFYKHFFLRIIKLVIDKKIGFLKTGIFRRIDNSTDNFSELELFGTVCVGNLF